MKRDMDLARQILLQIEAAPYGGRWVDLSLPSHSNEEVSYHIMLLAEAGLIEALDFSSLSGGSWRPRRLTWAGHEFLEVSRDESRWEKAKSIVKEKGGGVVFPVLKDLLIQLARQTILGS